MFATEHKVFKKREGKPLDCALPNRRKLRLAKKFNSFSAQQESKVRVQSETTRKVNGKSNNYGSAKSHQFKESIKFDSDFETEAQDSESSVREMIAQAAYYLAEQRGFDPAHQLDDWLQAEAEVSSRLYSR